ncbi:MAG: peptidylprolyl isomerase [Gallionella sp.]
MLKIKLPVLLSLLLLAPLSVFAQTQIDPQQQVATIDYVVAVVNNEVITHNELKERLRTVIIQLKKRGTPLPGYRVLEKQVLDRMVDDRLQAQRAKESGVRVNESQLDVAITRIAQKSGFPTLAAFIEKLKTEGVKIKKFREEIRAEIVATRLRKREVEDKLVISDAEVDQYLANRAKMGMTHEEYHLAHILVVVPEQASADKIQAARERADHAVSQLANGVDFAQVAAGTSDAKDALKGGDLGWRATDRIPPLFMNELRSLKPGENTGVLRSPSGFHILKLIDKRNGSAPVVITQTHARHILIKTSEIVSGKEAKKRIMEIKARIDAGADFAAQAKRYSQDGSAQQGGDLDWISPGQTVPAFEEALNKLKVGEIGMVESQFGWHLIQVLARRNTDVTAQQKRMQARISIASFKSETRYQNWMRQLRDRAFIEYHLNQESP